MGNAKEEELYINAFVPGATLGCVFPVLLDWFFWPLFVLTAR